MSLIALYIKELVDIQEDYLKALYSILMKKYNREEDIEWQDVSEVVATYQDSAPHRDTCRRQSKYLFDLLDGGYTIVPPSEETLQDKKNNASIGYDEKTNTYTYDKLIEICEGEVITPELIMQKHNIDPTKWQVVTYKNNYWNTQNSVDGKIIMYQSKLIVKPIQEETLDIEDIKQHFLNYAPTYSLKNHNIEYSAGDKMLVPCFFDVHFSKLAHADETGEHFDYKIAKQRVINSALAYMDRLRNETFDKILFVIGNDYFNSESDGATFNHTRQDNDSRYGKMFKKGVETLIEVIDIFAQKAPVEIVLIPGNHDTVISFYAACVLEAYYRNNDNISVDCSPKTRKYCRFGTNLIGLTHGSEEKDRIYGLMQVEAAQDWGQTTTHEWLIGHLHTEGTSEKMGVIVRRIPSLTGTDAWHAKMGYTMSAKRSCAFIYHKDKGLQEILYQGI